MKTKLLLVMLIVCFFACNDNEMVVMNNETTQEMSTEQMFIALNDSLMKLPHLQHADAQTRGGGWGNLLAVAAGDTYGALKGLHWAKGFLSYFGAATGGTGAVYAAAAVAAINGARVSYNVYNTTSYISPTPATSTTATVASTIQAYENVKFSPTTYVTLTIPTDFSHLNITAGMHNSILTQMNNEATATTSPTGENPFPNPNNLKTQTTNPGTIEPTYPPPLNYNGYAMYYLSTGINIY